jgi:hypothetical protein
LQLVELDIIWDENNDDEMHELDDGPMPQPDDEPMHQQDNRFQLDKNLG